MTSAKKDISKHIFNTMLYSLIGISFTALFIGLIYLLYKIAVTNKKLYTILFTFILTAFILYKIIKLILNHRGKIFIYKIIKFFSYITFIFILVLLIILPISLILRNIVLGIITELISTLIVIFCFTKLKPFILIKNFFNLSE